MAPPVPQPAELPGTVSTPFDGLQGRGQEWQGERATGNRFAAVSKALGSVAEGIPVVGGAISAFFKGLLTFHAAMPCA